MTRQRISTTVDADLVSQARALNPGGTDARMLDDALRALLDRFRRTEIDHAYAEAYATHGADMPDEWGDLASFGAAVRGAARAERS